MTDADTEAGRGEGLDELIRDMNGKPPREWTNEQIAAYLTDANAYKKAKYVGSGEVDCEAARRLRQSDPGGERSRELGRRLTEAFYAFQNQLGEDPGPPELSDAVHTVEAVAFELTAAPTDEASEGERDDLVAGSQFREFVCERCGDPFTSWESEGWPTVCPKCRPVAWMVEYVTNEGCPEHRQIYDGETAQQAARDFVRGAHNTGYVKARAVPLYAGESRWAFDNIALEDTGNIV